MLGLIQSHHQAHKYAVSYTVYVSIKLHFTQLCTYLDVHNIFQFQVCYFLHMLCLPVLLTVYTDIMKLKTKIYDMYCVMPNVINCTEYTVVICRGSCMVVQQELYLESKHVRNVVRVFTLYWTSTIFTLGVHTVLNVHYIHSRSTHCTERPLYSL
jgi:hypothetical protein